MRLELVPLDQIGALAGFYLVSCTPAAGRRRVGRRNGARVDQRVPPGHALSRIFTPTTNPSLTGMIVAASRGSRAANSLKARTPRALGDRSFGSIAAPWKKALSDNNKPPRLSSFMPQSKYLGSDSLSASMNTASKPGGSFGSTS